MSSTSAAPKLEDYTLLDRIGSGGYGQVYRAKEKATGQSVAVKAVQRGSLSSAAADRIVNEIRLLKTLDHPHIVTLRDFQCDANYIYIVMQYCGGGDLSHFVRARHRLPEAACQRFLQQLASALQYLRSENVGHFDLKPENVLLLSRRNPVIKLADFGLAQHLPESGDLSHVMGSPLYMAPEILLKNKYDSKVDLWSIGIILYECLFGKAPYSSPTWEELVHKIKSNKKIELPVNCSISEDCRNLLTRCLERNPDERISFEDFFNHPFIDLEHAPIPESLDKARELLKIAVAKDENKEFEVALLNYTESLRYLVPLVYIENDAAKRANLRKSASSYMKRTEALKKMLKEQENGTEISLVAPPQLPLERTESSDPSLGLTKTQEHLKCVQELVNLSKWTPSIRDAVDIARSGESYHMEGSFSIACDKYELALGKLIKLLQDEPGGRRRVLLSAATNYWMDLAERAKANCPAKADDPTPNQENSVFVDKKKNLIGQATLKGALKGGSSKDGVGSSEGQLITEKDYESNCALM